MSFLAGLVIGTFAGVGVGVLLMHAAYTARRKELEQRESVVGRREVLATQVDDKVSRSRRDMWSSN